jgi:hypothetical protein
MCGIAQSVVWVVCVAQILLRAHLRHPVQNAGSNTVQDEYGTFLKKNSSEGVMIGELIPCILAGQILKRKITGNIITD